MYDTVVGGLFVPINNTWKESHIYVLFLLVAGVNLFLHALEIRFQLLVLCDFGTAVVGLHLLAGV